MSITRSFNKHTNTWYAYETEYVYDEALGKKVQKRKCIGKFDPITGEVVRNAGRGRPKSAPGAAGDAVMRASAKASDKVFRKKILKKLAAFEKQADALASEIRSLREQIEEAVAEGDEKDKK